ADLIECLTGAERRTSRSSIGPHGLVCRFRKVEQDFGIPEIDPRLQTGDVPRIVDGHFLVNEFIKVIAGTAGIPVVCAIAAIAATGHERFDGTAAVLGTIV